MTDAAVDHLTKMTNLRVLHLEETDISPNGIAALQAALPKCAIFFTGGAIVPGWTSYTVAAPQPDAPSRTKGSSKKPKPPPKAKP